MKDGLDRAIALAWASRWLNENVVMKEWLDRIKREALKGGGDTAA